MNAIGAAASIMSEPTYLFTPPALERASQSIVDEWINNMEERIEGAIFPITAGNAVRRNQEQMTAQVFGAYTTNFTAPTQHYNTVTPADAYQMSGLYFSGGSNTIFIDKSSIVKKIPKSFNDLLKERVAV